MGRLAFVFLALLMGCCAAPAAEAARARVLIVGEDADGGGQNTSISRASPVYDRALETLSDAFKASGFETFDARSITATTTSQTDSDALGLARAAQRPPMDALVVFSVSAGLRKLSYTTDIHVRVTARMLDVKSGAKLGSFEVASPQGWRAPVNCETDCLVEVVGKNAKLLAVDVGAELAHKLASIVPATTDARTTTTTHAAPAAAGYTLLFTGFSADDLEGVEEYLVAFKGYKAHQAVAGAKGGQQYWYEFTHDGDALTQNLRMMLDRLGVVGRVTFSKTDRTFKVEKAASLQKAAGAIP